MSASTHTTYGGGRPLADGSDGFDFEPLVGDCGHYVKLVVESGAHAFNEKVREGVDENFVVPHGGREEGVSKGQVHPATDII
jgi:hypothetical protein